MADAPDNDTRATAEQAHGAAVLQGLTPSELIEILNKVRLFAARRYHGQLNADDLAMQAITDALAGKRTWNANYSPFHNLCWIVRSIAFNQLQKEGRLLSHDPDAEAGSSRAVPLLPTHPSPAEIHETNETQRSLRELLRRAVDDDSLLLRVVALYFERQVWKPKEMAAALNVSEPEIYKAKRRIQRRLSKLLNKS
jgi:RNA polymerase sigma factor (sigma-70 family)